jgi:hypothetical protein
MSELNRLFRLIRSALSTPIVAGSLMLAAASAAEPAVQNPTPAATSAGQPFQMTETRGDRHFETDGRGQVTFTEDLTDVRTLSDAGYIVIRAWTENSPATAQVIEIRSHDGTLSRSYSVGGTPRPWDEEAGKLLAMNLGWLVRRSGLSAQSRVRQLFEAKGLTGVLGEVQALESDYVRRLYLIELLRIGRLDGAALARTLSLAGATLRSPNDLLETLVAAAPAAAHDEAAGHAYATAIGSLSDYERRRALAALLGAPGLAPEVAREALRAAAMLRTDYEKTETLIAALEVVLADATEAEVRDAFFAAMKTLRSDAERRRLLAALVGRRTLPRDMLDTVIEGAATMMSDYDRAELLLAIVKTQPIESGDRDAMIAVLDRMRSPYDRDRVLAALSRSQLR